MYYGKAAVTMETYFEHFSVGQRCATQIERQMWFTTGDRQVILYTVCDSGCMITHSLFWEENNSLKYFTCSRAEDSESTTV